MKAIVTVGLKPGVLDVQGKAVANALHDLGFGDVTDARVGKVIEIDCRQPALQVFILPDEVGLMLAAQFANKASEARRDD